MKITSIAAFIIGLTALAVALKTLQSHKQALQNMIALEIRFLDNLIEIEKGQLDIMKSFLAKTIRDV